MPQVFIRHPLTGQPVILTKGAISSYPIAQLIVELVRLLRQKHLSKTVVEIASFCLQVVSKDKTAGQTPTTTQLGSQ